MASRPDSAFFPAKAQPVPSDVAKSDQPPGNGTRERSQGQLPVKVRTIHGNALPNRPLGQDVEAEGRAAERVAAMAQDVDKVKSVDGTPCPETARPEPYLLDPRMIKAK